MNKAVAILPRKSRWYWYHLITIYWPLFYLDTCTVGKTFSVIYFDWSEFRIDRRAKKTHPLYIYQYYPNSKVTRPINKFMRGYCKRLLCTLAWKILCPVFETQLSIQILSYTKVLKRCTCTRCTRWTLYNKTFRLNWTKASPIQIIFFSESKRYIVWDRQSNADKESRSRDPCCCQMNMSCVRSVYS